MEEAVQGGEAKPETKMSSPQKRASAEKVVLVRLRFASLSLPAQGFAAWLGSAILR